MVRVSISIRYKHQILPSDPVLWTLSQYTLWQKAYFLMTEKIMLITLHFTTLKWTDVGTNSRHYRIDHPDTQRIVTECSVFTKQDLKKEYVVPIWQTCSILTITQSAHAIQMHTYLPMAHSNMLASFLTITEKNNFSCTSQRSPRRTSCSSLLPRQSWRRLWTLIEQKGVHYKSWNNIFTTSVHFCASVF